MKKLSSLLLTLAIIIGTFNLTAMAFGTFFTDQNSFDNWFAASAYKMRHNRVMTGYPDGTFQGGNPVSRAELAVILDRFAENVVGKELRSEPIACTAMYASGLEIILQDQHGDPIEGATIITSPQTSDFAAGSAGNYSGLYEEEGTFEFVISKPGYSSHNESIVLEKDDCHVITQSRTITLIKR